MFSLNTNQAAIIAGNIQESSWLFDITTVAGARYRWSLDAGAYAEAESTDTWDATLYTPSYEFKIIPDSFSGIELQRNRSEFNMVAPADVRFAAGNAGGTLTAADFVDAQVTIRIRVSSATDTQELPGWRFIVQRCESATGKLDFHCTSFIHRYLRGDWPNTELVRNLVVEETGTEINDNYCVPVIVGTAYIPLRSLYIVDGRYYLLGQASHEYSVTEVSSPGTDQGKSTWLSSSYDFAQSTKNLKGVDYQVFQPIIADADLDGTADSCGLWVSNGAVLDMPAKVTDLNNVTSDYSSPSRFLAYLLKDFGVPADLIDDVETYSSFVGMTTIMAGRGISFNGGYYYRRPRQEVLAEVLTSMNCVLDVNETITIRSLSKTSWKTIGLGDVVVSDTGKERNARDLLSAFKYDAIIQTDSDAGYVAFPAGDRSQAEMLKVLVSAKGSTDNISGQTLALPLINKGITAQPLACLYFQRRFLRYASLSFRGKPSLYNLQPDMVVSFNNDYFGGAYSALIESTSINRDLSINFSLTRFKEALDDWADLSFSEVVPVVDSSATSQTWSTITAGPASSPDGGRMPNSLPGPLRIGQTGNYILLDPSEPVMSFAEGGVVRLKIGDLGVDDYGVQIWDANGVSILKLDGAGVSTLSGWNLSQYAITADSGLVGLNSEVTGDTDWRIWAGHATPASAPFRVDEDGNLYASSATLEGTVTAYEGVIGGFTLGTTSLTTTSFGIHAGASGQLLLGHATDYATAKIGLKNDGSGKLASGNISWDASGAITLAGSLTSTATITGGTIQTAASGARAVLTSTGLAVYDATAQRAQIGADGAGWLAAADKIAWTSAGVLTVGGWTIDATTLTAGDLSLDSANTRIQAGPDANSYVRISPEGIVGVDSVLGTTFSLPTDGSAPTFSSGIINSTIFNITSAGILETSATAGDGTASGQGVRINDVGIKGWAADDATPKFFLDATSGVLTATGATLSGTVTAAAGTIGGFTLGATTIVGGNLQLNNGGSIQAGTGDDIIRISAADASYRLAIGDNSMHLAPFRVTKGGSLTCTGANVSGTIVSYSGTIGGWNLAGTTLTGGSVTLASSGNITAGTSNNVVRISASDATYRLWVGHATAASAPFSVTKEGVLTCTGATISGAVTITSGSGIGNLADAGDLATQDRADLNYADGADVTSTIISGGLVTTGTLEVAQGGTVAAGITGNTSGDTATRIWAGSAFAGRATAPFRVTQAGLLYATGATISGAITATSGTIGGFTATTTTLASGTNIVINASDKSISINDATYGNSGAQLQYNGGAPRFHIGNKNGSGPYMEYASGVLTAREITSAAGSVERIMLNRAGNNHMEFYGDAGGGVELLGEIGMTTVGSDSVCAVFGSTTVGNSKTGIYGRSRTSYGGQFFSTTGTGLYGISLEGVAISAYGAGTQPALNATSLYGVVLQAAAGTASTRGTLRLVPKSNTTLPTAPQTGEFVVLSSGSLRYYNGASWVTLV